MYSCFALNEPIGSVERGPALGPRVAGHNPESARVLGAKRGDVPVVKRPEDVSVAQQTGGGERLCEG
eukprot:13297760-Alexandrium_andersonii.AAC.1